MQINKIALVIMALLFVTCSNDDDKTENPVFCTEEARPGLEIMVRGASDRVFLTDGVTVIVRDNEYTETLENVSDTNTFFGAYERAGTYTIIVSKNGYKTSTSDPVIVSEDICHVITEVIEVLLEKN